MSFLELDTLCGGGGGVLPQLVQQHTLGSSYRYHVPVETMGFHSCIYAVGCYVIAVFFSCLNVTGNSWQYLLFFIFLPGT
jgi:hypothetical protein